ncbi:hypothetical protein HYH02_002234 [Chlamydomonas schloesseri]|uniref:RING-type domain-containing protein n=1 Tax=Chlamydomonas schloesseri TaxID=2026947 RepID=A0A835WSI1_9CHLO|nr:hypothetical protein HYH02_002234 [Chlamydomonas schloesseri]|eukprot:KAG2452890.1 hypothetical protein HYH02_002234 [Chlamydomonas schloesseri]
MGATLSSCVEPGNTFALFEAVRAGDVRRIHLWLGMQPELLKYRNLSDGDTVWHVAAVVGSPAVLEALAEHAPALQELEAQRRRLQQRQRGGGSFRRHREEADAAGGGGVTPGAELAGAAARAQRVSGSSGSGGSGGSGGGGSGGGSSGSDTAAGALSEVDGGRASASERASSQAATPSGAATPAQVDEQQQQQQQQQLGQGQAVARAVSQVEGHQLHDHEAPPPPPDTAAQAARAESLRAVINLRSDKHQTPLMHAANAGRLDVLKWLLQQGADPWAQDRCGLRSALHYAAMRGRVECVLALLDHMPSTQELRRYLEYRSISGLTPLHYAVATGQTEVAKLLLQRGADLMAVNLIGDAYDLVHVPKRSTPLHIAAALPGPSGLQCALALLQHYHHNLAGPNYPAPRRRVDITGRTPYQVATFYRGQSALMTELLHPASDLAALFEREGGGGGGAAAGGGSAAFGGAGGYIEGASVAVPVLRLKQIAAAAVRQQLLNDIEHAERVIQHFWRRHRAAAGSSSLDRLSPFARSSSPAVGDDQCAPPLPGGVNDSRGGGGLEQLTFEPPGTRTSSWSGSGRSGSRRAGGAAACCPLEMQLRVGGCEGVAAAPAPAGKGAGGLDRQASACNTAACGEASCCEAGSKGCGHVKAPAGCCPGGATAAAAVVVPCGEVGAAAKTCCGADEESQAAGADATSAEAAGATAGLSVLVVPCCTPEERRLGACCAAPCVCSSNCRAGPIPTLASGGADAADAANAAGAAAAPALLRASSKPGLAPPLVMAATTAGVNPRPSTSGSSSLSSAAAAATAALLQGPLPGCCTVRQPSRPFASRSLGYVEEGGAAQGGRRVLRAGAGAGAAAGVGRAGAFATAPLMPVAQCAVCLEDAFCLVSEPCHHRLCATCSRDVTQRATTLPLACVVCREPVFQFTSPVC